MTAHVKKGANRAAHNARTARAAQRTPLPPKGSGPIGNPSVEALKDEVAKAKAPKAPQPANSGRAKAEALAAFASPHGWAAEITQQTDEIVEVHLVRVGSAEERIVASWINGVVTDQNLPHYRIGTVERVLRNISAARKLIEVPPNSISVPVPRVTRTPAKPKAPRGQKAQTVTTPEGERVLAPVQPHFSSDTPDEEVLASVRNHTVVWRNSISNMRDQAFVSGDSKHIRLSGQNGHRVLEFSSNDGGFRAVRVDAIEYVR